MQSRNTYSLVATLLIIAASCARQAEPEDAPNDEDNGDTLAMGGSLSSGGRGGASGSTSTSNSGSTSTGKGGSGTTLPPAGSVGGKPSKGGSSSGGSANDGGAEPEGGSTGSGGSGGTGTTHMPVEGLTLQFKATSSTSEVNWLGGELLFSNVSAQPFALADLKIRYYFTNEIANAETSVNWAQFGPVSAMGPMTCTTEIVAMAEPTAGADSYVELSCGAGEMKANTALKTDWKAGSNASGVFKLQQADDYSFTAMATDWDKIVVLDGNNVIWGSEP